MGRIHARRLAAGAMILGLVLASTVAPATVSAGKDRTAPKTPTNLRITGMTPYSISLAWNASSDASGIASYQICCTNNHSQTVSGSATTATYTAGVESGRQFSLFIIAWDNAGNASKMSNTVTGTTPRDTTPPTKPIVSVTNVGPTSVSLAWSTIEEGPVWWFVYRDGTAVFSADRATSGTIPFLEPETSYTFTVRAHDFGGNDSPLSDPLTVTTEARDTTDTTPPSVPGNLRTNGMQFADGETWLFWDQSTDAVTAQSLIEYKIFLNGTYDHSTVGFGRTILYGTPNSQNTYTVIAVDESGNESAPATIVVDNF